MKSNKPIQIIVSTLGIFIGFVGIISHGFFEIQQGNTPTTGLIIQSVGEGNIMGAPPGEEVLTLIPNFLVSGICTILVSLSIIIWSESFIHKKQGSEIFLLLCIIQMLVGGGIAQIVVVLIIWRASVLTSKPSTWMQKILARKLWRKLSNFWLQFLILGIVVVFTATQIALYQFFPGVDKPIQTMYISLFMLVFGIGIFIITILVGFAYDIARQKNSTAI